MMTLQKVFNRVTGSLVTLGSWIFFLFMFNVVADVTGRYLFGKPIR
jgi:TRAP-type mannitol/chloroaromatic compound transport system permease small subunit